MVKAGGGIGFGAEAPGRFLPRKMREEHHFQSDDAVEAAMTGAINDTHAAAGDLFQQLVLAQRNGCPGLWFYGIAILPVEIIGCGVVGRQQLGEKAHWAETCRGAWGELALAFGTRGRGWHNLNLS